MGGLAAAVMMIGVGEGVLGFETRLIWFCCSRRWQREFLGVSLGECLLDRWIRHELSGRAFLFLTPFYKGRDIIIQY